MKLCSPLEFRPRAPSPASSFDDEAPATSPLIHQTLFVPPCFFNKYIFILLIKRQVLHLYASVKMPYLAPHQQPTLPRLMRRQTYVQETIGFGGTKVWFQKEVVRGKDFTADFFFCCS